MATILKEKILQEQRPDTVGKEKIDKIVDTIVEQPVAKSENEAKYNEAVSGQKESKDVQKKHYIFSDTIIIAGDNAAELEVVRDKITEELKPSGEIESIIVDRIVSSVWRLKRCLMIEGRLMEFGASNIGEYEQGIFQVRKRTDDEIAQLKAIGMIGDKDRLDELARYENMLEKQIYKALCELDKIRKRESRKEQRKSRRG